MTYDYLLPVVLFGVVVFFCGNSISAYKISRLGLALTAIIAIAPKIISFYEPFYGLEYEDAYSFQAQSKYLDQRAVEIDRYRVQIPNYNVASKSTEVHTFNGHFISLSSIAGLLNKLFGYSELRVLQLNAFISVLLGLIIYSTCVIVTRDHVLSLMAPLLLYSAPTINLFQTSGLSETFSSFAIASFLLSLLIFHKSTHAPPRIFLPVLCSLLLSLMVKRENMALLVFLPYIIYKLYLVRNFWHISILTGSLAAYFWIVRPFSTEFIESATIGQSTFSVEFFAAQFPVYIDSLLTFKYFGFVLIIFVLLYMKFAMNKLKPQAQTVVTSLLFLMYVVTYSSHYRSNDFAETLSIGNFETFRYLNNFFFLLVLAIVFAIHQFQVRLSDCPTRGILALGVLLYFFGFVFSQSFRSAMYQEEQNVRIVPISQSLLYLSEDLENQFKVLVTNIPTVALMQEDVNELIYISKFSEFIEYSRNEDLEHYYFLIPESQVQQTWNIDIIHQYKSHLLFKLPDKE